jgi:hypothetical protein
MLPPPPTSRQSSYAYSIPRAQSHSHHHPSRIPSFAQSHIDTEFDEDEENLDGTSEEGEDRGDLNDRIEREEELDGPTEAGRGLEETLEKLGFGQYSISTLRKPELNKLRV